MRDRRWDVLGGPCDLAGRARRSAAGLILLQGLCGLLLGCGGDAGQPPGGEPAGSGWSVSSPSGDIVIRIDKMNLAGTAGYPDAENLYYRVADRGVPVLDWSPLGISTTNAAFESDLAFVGHAAQRLDETYEVPTGKERLRHNRCHERTLRFRHPDGAEMEIVVRAYDDGAAFRYRLLGEGPAEITGEASGFRLPEGAIGWMQPYDRPAFGTPAYENTYRRVEAGDESPEDGWSYPALFRLEAEDRFVLLTEAGLDRGYCGTRLEGTAPDRVYRVRFPSAGEGLGVGKVRPEGTLPWTTPWRVILAGGLARVVESSIVTHLSAPRDPAFGQDPDWIRPGRVAWSWWSQGTGDAALQREYVDSAAEFGWEYVLVDARWDRWPEAEASVEALSRYAQDRGVGLVLWYNSGGPHNLVITETPRGRMHERARRQAEFRKIAGWGVRGVKVDFFHSDKQDRIRQYLDILEDAAAERLLVDFHGCTLPRGWERQYPNLMTMEAVYGGEQYKWHAGPNGLDNVRLVFTRNVVGSMDYTPVTFESALARRGLTFAHQLALSVVFESGWQCYADRADANPAEGYRKVFASAPAVREFLREAPAAWDETRLLAGDPDSHAVLARRSGGRWFVAGISAEGTEPVTVSLPLEFLGPGAYEVTWIGSGATPREFRVETGRKTAADRLLLTLPPRDGFAAVFTPPA